MDAMAPGAVDRDPPREEVIDTSSARLSSVLRSVNTTLHIIFRKGIKHGRMAHIIQSTFVIDT
jgi:hypothetical protein